MNVVVSCARVDEIDDPTPGSTVTNCTTCGVAVWWDAVTGVDIAGDDRVLAYCTACVPKDLPVSITPAQIALLRSDGADDVGIARTLAMIQLTDGNPATVPSMMAELERNPGGPTARRYRELVADSFVALARAEQP